VSGRVIGLVLVLAWGLGIDVSAAQLLQNVNLSAPPASSTSTDNSAAWDEIDRQVGLTGLWGSIDPYLDTHPSLYTRPADGRLYLFWSKWNGQFYEIVFASRGVGGTWGLLLKVQPQPNSTLNNLQPRVVVDASGRLNAVWIRSNGSGSSVYHAVRFGTIWSAPTRVSVEENARRPVPRVDAGRTLVEYRTPSELVTVEVVVVVSAGGSDDIDPTQEGAVDVESYELRREVILK
jgi:hypothetical protein